MRKANYDKFPSVSVPSRHASECWVGWDAVLQRISRVIDEGKTGRRVLAVECYAGVFADDIARRCKSVLGADLIIETKNVFHSAAKIDEIVAPFLGGDDPVFGYMTNLQMQDFLDREKVKSVRHAIQQSQGLVLVIGAGAALVAEESDLLIYADMPRWEGQLRQRRNEVSNLGVENKELKASLQYKRSFFIDWRVCDRLKKKTMKSWDFLLDTTHHNEPKLITGEAHLAGLDAAVRQPFRVVPFFDPGPWGGQWMKEVCDLDRKEKNFAWCFDCVPEENSLLLAFGKERVEIPSINLVFYAPERLLGEAVYGRFGAEFPIRFDFLDTMGGGNLSFQVHPDSGFAQEHFGLQYTQDESYYMLDARDDAVVYLGRKNDADLDEMISALEAAQRGEGSFPDEKFVGKWTAKKHDHFLIPAGTVHCSGANGMVLEISATPYIFTFKLWDWNRMGMDGLPRPVNIPRGKQVIRWERDEDYTKARLINQITELSKSDGWREERTGLHEAEFIETRRHWFTKPVTHHRTGSVEVLNLVEGWEAMVESVDGRWKPFVVHYAETFILPAAAGDYVIRPHGESVGAECATLKAFVRTKTGTI